MAEPANRTEQYAVHADWKERFYNKKNVVDNTTHTFGTPFKGSSTRTGIKLPSWQSVIRNGGNATTPLVGTRYVGTGSFITAGVEWQRQDGHGYEDYGAEYYGHPLYPTLFNSTPAAPASVVTNVTNRCIRKFLDRAEAVRSSVEAGQDFGEYKETLHGMISPLGQLRKHVLSYFPKVRKLRKLYGDARSLTKALADTYLEWTFGWKPLVSDIAQAYVGLQNRNRFGDRQAIRVSAADNFQVSPPASNQLSSLGGLGSLSISNRVTGYYTVVMYGMIRTGTSQDGTVSRAQVLQLDLPHFVPTIWDLIPYSFIVDYFVNVGEIIRSLSTIDSVFMWGGQDQITDHIQEYSDAVISDFAQPAYMTKVQSWAHGGRGRFEHRLTNRSVLVPAGLIPKVQITLPLSSKPWVNMGAIMASHLSSLIPL
jgi:hypothetical protein